VKKRAPFEFCLLTIIVLFLYQNILAREIITQTHPSNVQGYVQFATTDVLVAFYMNTAGGVITEDKLTEIKNGIELSKKFFWRNSGCKLNLNISYLEISEYKTRTFFPASDYLIPKSIGDDLRSLGINEDQYGIIVLIYSPSSQGKNRGGMNIFENIGFVSLAYPLKQRYTFRRMRIQ
jgi:hypothetical protein